MTGDELVTAYLNRLRRVTRGLAADRRDDLVLGVSEHIREARASTEDDVEQILARLGTPEQIAYAAGAPVRRTERQIAYDLVTIGLIGLGSICLSPLGWLAGVVMLAIGPRWTVRDRWIGALAPPLGASGVLFLSPLWFGLSNHKCVSYNDGPMSCTPPAASDWLILGLQIAIVVTGIATCGYLGYRAAHAKPRSSTRESDSISWTPG